MAEAPPILEPVENHSNLESIIEKFSGDEEPNQSTTADTLAPNLQHFLEMNENQDDLIKENQSSEQQVAEENGSQQQDDVVIVESQGGETYTYKCVFCERVLTGNDSPKLLECLHNVCGTCICNKLEEGENERVDCIQCPSCNMVSALAAIIDNQFLIELSNTEDNSSLKTADIKCSSCNDDAIAVSYCVDCSEYICDSCVQAHQRLKITKDHTIKSKEYGCAENQGGTSITGSNVNCSVHPHEKLSLFCLTCDKLTCRDCQLIEHRDHKYQFTHEIASDTRKCISTMLQDVSYKRILLTSAMKVIANRQTLIAEKKAALVKEITQLVVKLTNTINVRGKQLVSRLNDVCEQKQNTLQEKKVALDELSRMTDHCIEFTQHALETGSDRALLSCKRPVTNHLQRIKRKRADIPNPEIPLRINLALDKVPDLIKVIASIGQIVVDGRVYPGSSGSPVSSLPAQGSPSPGHSHSTSPMAQPPLQSGPSNFQHRMPPPYNQFPARTGGNFQGNNLPGCSPPIHTSKGPPNMTVNYVPLTVPASVMQQIDHNIHRAANRPAILPRTAVQKNRMPNHHQQEGTQVSSSTHPQGLMQERNLRGLLQSKNGSHPVYVQTGPSQYQAVEPQFVHQLQTRFQLQQFGPQQGAVRAKPPNQAFNRMPTKTATLHHGQPHQQQQAAKWHIPQQAESVGNNTNRTQLLPGFVDNYKIALKPPGLIDGKPAAVSSTIPKTPSPNHVPGKNETERSFDKFCQDSVNDLMATIAKLDSNGVQVLAEGARSKTGGSPHADSSTDGVSAPPIQVKIDPSEMGKDDPNEDWCAVCMDGGELVCCDKCPKVFHQFCHIPNLSVEESDTWQCLLCMNFADIPENALGERQEGELSPKDRKLCERLVLELYCQYEPSLPFREIIGPENTEYHAVIKNPIALDTIRHKLDWNVEGHYTSIEALIQDIKLMFHNAYTYNEEGSQIYNDARKLEQFFVEQLEKFLPNYLYESTDDDSQPPSKKYKRTANE